MNLRAVGHSVILKPAPPVDKTASGMVIPVAWQQPNGQGVVLSVGGKVKDEALKPGVEVVYSWINCKEFEHEGEKVAVIHAGSLQGVKHA